MLSSARHTSESILIYSVSIYLPFPVAPRVLTRQEVTWCIPCDQLLVTKCSVIFLPLEDVGVVEGFPLKLWLLIWSPRTVIYFTKSCTKEEMCQGQCVGERQWHHHVTECDHCSDWDNMEEARDNVLCNHLCSLIHGICRSNELLQSLRCSFIPRWEYLTAESKKYFMMSNCQ